MTWHSKKSILFIFMILAGIALYHRPLGLKPYSHSNFKEEKLFILYDSNVVSPNADQIDRVASFGTNKSDTQINLLVVQFKKFHHKTLSILHLNDRNHGADFIEIRNLHTAHLFADFQQISQDRIVLSTVEMRQ
jgi:hypothetical protein